MPSNKTTDDASSPIDWQRLEQVIRHDPGRRGLASYVDDQGRPLLGDELRTAAKNLAKRATRVLIVTGFCVVLPNGTVTAETDGPPGAIYLAAMLRATGIDVKLISDVLGRPLVAAGLAAAQLPSELRLDRASGDFSHLVAIERVGPSHTTASIAAQYGAESAESREFERLIPAAEQSICRNMRGISIDAHTAPLHRLFERDDENVNASPPTTIGIVDGGNEIGCGKIPWGVLRHAVKQGNGAQIACRIMTDHTIVAGVSNWGAYALGASVACHLGHQEAVAAWTVDKQRAVIEAIVRHGGAVDGVTKRREATVDGLPLDEYLAVFDEIRRIAVGG